MVSVQYKNVTCKCKVYTEVVSVQWKIYIVHWTVYTTVGWFSVHLYWWEDVEFVFNY